MNFLVKEINEKVKFIDSFKNNINDILQNYSEIKEDLVYLKNLLKKTDDEHEKNEIKNLK